MATVTLTIGGLDEAKCDLKAAFEGRRIGSSISFATPELLWQILTQKRWEILRAMTGQGPLSIREIARRVGRDVKAVHTDVHALLKAGVIDRTEDGRVEFPFDAIHVDFEVKAA
jgi:predicted transcriptional regulator